MKFINQIELYKLMIVNRRLWRDTTHAKHLYNIEVEWDRLSAIRKYLAVRRNRNVISSI